MDTNKTDQCTLIRFVTKFNEVCTQFSYILIRLANSPFHVINSYTHKVFLQSLMRSVNKTSYTPIRLAEAGLCLHIL